VVGQAVSPANFQATKRKITKRTQGMPLLVTSCRSTRAKLRNEPNEPGASVVGQAVSPANFQATNRKL